jgi:ABC-type transport system involved in multi-copper enzyme maturation permease subunit
MRPYLAIIKDSFRAALATRVLYVLLGLITVLLVALAPFHVREVLDWKIQLGQHVPNPEKLARRLVEGKEEADRPDIQRIWAELPTGLRDDLVDIINERDPDADRKTRSPGAGNRIQKYQDLIKELNSMIEDDEFYRKEDWEGRPQNSEAEELIEKGVGSLSDEQSRRLNRLLIANAVSPAIQAGSPTSLDFYYATFRWGFLSTNQTQQQFASNVANVIPAIFDKFVMSIGLFIAILVTANIIPETFEPGSLNLLLSKPITRSGLFISKFIGGCAFVALCAVYLFLGTWIWLGINLGVWDRAFLLSIPLYILVFAIYYSVSAFIGLVYRSAIMAIVVTGLFWAICFAVGSVYGFLNTRMENLQLVELSPVGEETVCVNGIGQVVAWDEGDAAWESQAQADMRDDEEMAIGIAMYMGRLREEATRMPPVIDAQSQIVLMGLTSIINPLGRDYQDCFAKQKGDVQFKNIGKLPRDAMRLFAGKDGPIVVTASGRVYQLASEDLTKIVAGAAVRLDTPDTNSDQADMTGETQQESMVTTTQSGENVEQTSGRAKSKTAKVTNQVESLFKRIGPDRPVSVRRITNVDFNHQSEQLAIYDRGNLVVFGRTGEQYERLWSLEINTGVSPTMSCLVAYEGDTIMLVLGNGQVITVDTDRKEELKGYQPETRFAIDRVTASPDGRWFALVYRNKTVWLLDTQNPDQMSKLNVFGQGDISTVSFDSQSRIWVVDRTDRACRYEMDSLSKQVVRSPSGNWLDWTYRYVVRPFYRVCPKPSEFYKVVTHLSSASDASSNRDVDLRRAEKPDDPWSPLWSGLGFMFTILLISCVVFHFKDY